ncbi:MAG TPA: hypothetical protein VJA21_07875 [Verrucomicrobiae bacterium]
MKNNSFPLVDSFKTVVAILALAATGVSQSRADFVYVTATTSNCTDAATCRLNQDYNVNFSLVYNENYLGDFTSAVSLAPGKPATAGARYFSTSFASGSTPDYGITVSPTLGVTGGVYRVYHVFSSAAANVSTNVVLGVTNVEGCTLSFTNTDKFQSKYGVASGGMNPWQFLGFLTNAPDTSTPKMNFFWESGDVDAGAQKRLLVDTFLFLSDECATVAPLGISGAYSVSSTTVTVTGIDVNATAIKVYQYANDTWSLVGQRTTSITNATLTVTVSGLVKGGQLAATQTLNGLEGCLWGVPTGIVIGVPNPRVRLALSLRETPSTGPAGTPGVTTGGSTGNIHFLGVTNRLSAAPGTPGQVIYPSNAVWQTVTFDAGFQTVGNASNAVGTLVPGPGYLGNSPVEVQVYAYRTVAANSVVVYSSVGAQTAAVTSNDTFAVNWSWDSVPGAEGYRLLRSVASSGYNEYVDVVAATTYSDANNAWLFGNTVAPSRTQTGPSVKWNSASGDMDPVGTISGLRSNWYTIDALAFAIDDLTTTGPHDIYLDTIQNGETVFYNMEPAPAGSSDYALRAPGFSGSTSGNLAGAPNSAAVVNSQAYEGTKSMRLQWAWNGTTATKWVRLTTSGVGNPQVNVNDPITLRFLYVPDGGTYPPAPERPALSADTVGSDMVLNWVGGHRLQTAVDVSGVYTNVPQVLSPNTYTNITRGAFLAPWTNTFTEPTRFFRLAD